MNEWLAFGIVAVICGLSHFSAPVAAQNDAAIARGVPACAELNEVRE